MRFARKNTIDLFTRSKLTKYVHRRFGTAASFGRVRSAPTSSLTMLGDMSGRALASR